MFKKRKYLINGAIVVLFLIVFYFATNTKNANGFMWEATKDGKSVYLVGSLHPAKIGINYESKTLNKIIDKTDLLAVELDFSNPKIANQVQDSIKDSDYLKDGELKDFISSSSENNFYKMIDEFNLNYEEIKKLSPCGFLNKISDDLGEEVKLKGKTTEDYLQSKYRQLDREIVSLESPDIDSKINYTDELEYSLTNYEGKKALKDEYKAHYQNIEDAYISGDDTYLVENASEFVDTEFDKMRNINMSNKIDKLVSENKKCLVLVGTYHFFGNESILNHLRTKGYEIKKL